MKLLPAALACSSIVLLLSAMSGAVTFDATNAVPNTTGGGMFDQYMGVDYAKKVLSNASSFVWNTFNQTSPGDRKPIDAVALVVQDIAGASFTSNNIIHLSAAYIVEMTDDVKTTVTGLLFHEVTHVWQWNRQGQANSGLLEGIADFVRMKAGYATWSWVKPGQGDSWDQGYDVTARFLDYCNSLKPGFVALLNAKMKDRYSDDFFSQITGKTVHQLWQDYSRASTTYSEDIEEIKAMLLDPLLVRASTDNFAEVNKLGEGGFGQVYKGWLHDGVEVAVKRLAKESKQGIRELKNELLLLAKLQHRNLVKLIGACLDEEEKLLVYEYIPNKSLDAFIFDDEKRKQLVWETRYKIVCGIARGMVYLHDESRVKVIHRDLKPSNILLEKDMNPKICDFGLARIFEGDHTKDITRRVAGTYGYMAPEYAVLGHVSTKSDVFSFGVIVLEIVTGRRNTTSSEGMMAEHILSCMGKLDQGDSNSGNRSILAI